MTRLLVHIGTGTIVDLDDNCVFINPPESMNDADEDELVEYAMTHGRPVNTSVDPDVTYGNIVCYSPSALREEAREIIHDITDEYTKEALQFVISKATDKDLYDMAGFILNGDAVWTTFRDDIIDASRQALEWSKEK